MYHLERARIDETCKTFSYFNTNTMTQAKQSKYFDPFQEPGRLIMPAKLFVEVSQEAKTFIESVEFFIGITDGGCGGASGIEILDSFAGYLLQDDWVFREVFENEMYKALADYIYGTVDQVKALANERVEGILALGDTEKRLPWFDWEVLTESIQSFVNKGCSERTHVLVYAEEYDEQQLFLAQGK